MNKRDLKPITQSPDFSLYDISISENSNLKTYILSTPETRELTTNPFLVGKSYRNSLGSAIKSALSNPELNNTFKDEKDEKLNVLHFLRGGLNFEILDVLGEIGKNNTRASFMSSERTFQNNQWAIRDDQYIKVNLSDNSTVFIGDIIATGSTLKCALEKIPQNKIKTLFLFTLGGEESEKILLENKDKFKNAFLIYIEGLFHMAKSETPARIKITGTDLLPWQATLAPEFEKALTDKPINAIERCIVYDGGSRGFYPSHHFKDVLEYTNQIKEELNKGATLFDLILDRWENASSLPEETKEKLTSKEFAEQWLTQRTEKINTLLS